MPQLERHVYFFGPGCADGSAAMRDVLGGKGAGLAEIANLAGIKEQRAHGAVRTVLRHVAEAVVELDDDGLCCGAGGVYSQLQPWLAGEIRDRKVAAIELAAAGRSLVVASANPGCALHLGAAWLRVAHPMDLVAEVVV